MIRIAAAGDVHFDRDSAGRLSQYLKRLDEKADLLLLAGDLTQTGHEDEAETLAADLAHSPVPVIAVLGNHDFHLDRETEVTRILTSAGVTVLERTSIILPVNGDKVGIVGMKGFGGGFVGACASDFGEKEMKTFVRHTKELASTLKTSLETMNTDYRIALLHYSPVPETLTGEKKEIYPFLGSYLLAEAVDEGGADIIFHGHAHKGVEKGTTPGGIPVRNVAQPVIRHAFNIYSLNKEGLLHRSESVQHA